MARFIPEEGCKFIVNDTLMGLVFSFFFFVMQRDPNGCGSQQQFLWEAVQHEAGDPVRNK